MALISAKKASEISFSICPRYGRNFAKCACGPCRLLTFPRIIGMSFNPLSVYVAQNDLGADILYIYEVRNTFGDMHAYIGTPEMGIQSEAQKIFTYRILSSVWQLSSAHPA